MEKIFCAVKTRRRLSISALVRDGSHGLRAHNCDNPSRYDPARRSENQFGSAYHDDPTDVAACVKASAAARGAKFRKSASLAQEMIFIVSPGFFGKPADPQKVQLFRDRTLSSVERRWPGATACWRLDLDETTPHLNVWLVPVKEKVLKSGSVSRHVSVKDDFSGHRRQLSELQDWYAEQMADLGISRGQRNSEGKAKAGLSPSEYRSQQASLSSMAEKEFINTEARSRALSVAIDAYNKGEIFADTSDCNFYFADGLSEERQNEIHSAISPFIDFAWNLTRPLEVQRQNLLSKFDKVSALYSEVLELAAHLKVSHEERPQKAMRDFVSVKRQISIENNRIKPQVAAENDPIKKIPVRSNRRSDRDER